MNIRNLFVSVMWKEVRERIPVENWRRDEQTGHNKLLITVFQQPLWVDATLVKLYKGRGSTFCWKDHQQGQYVELNENNEVCSACGWWKCHVCNSCRCNKP